MARTLVTLDVHPEDVENVLMRLNMALSPVGMMGFLSTTVAPFIRRRASARFAGEGDDVVGKWLPLAESTVDIRSRMNLPIGGEHPINQRTGDLYDYITESPADVQPLPMGAQLTYPGVAATGWLEEKVKTAQTGKTHPATPPRPVLGLGVQDLAFVMGSLGIAIQKAGTVR